MKEKHPFRLHSLRIKDHYANAREKHPYFCDELIPDMKLSSAASLSAAALDGVRFRIKKAVSRACLTWEDLLDCEVWETVDALVNGNRAQAVEELYDCVAVLLRTVDVIENRQPLGNPETKGKTK